MTISDWIDWGGQSENPPMGYGISVQVILFWQPATVFSGLSDSYQWDRVSRYRIVNSIPDTEGETDPTDAIGDSGDSN